ncbi:hypothetical protein MRX96_001739 [Rhipicephalus microplus]
MATVLTPRPRAVPAILQQKDETDRFYDAACLGACILASDRGELELYACRFRRVVNSASILDPRIPPPDLPQEIPSSSSLSFEDMEVLTSIVPDTTEPHQTMIAGNKIHTLPLHKAGLSEDANKISRNLTEPCLQTTHTFIFKDAPYAQPRRHLAPKGCFL